MFFGYSRLKKLYIEHRLWLFLLLITLTLFIIFLIPLLIWVPFFNTITKPESIKTLVLSFGNWSAVVYILLSILVIIAPTLPNEIVSIAGGMIFGFWPALFFGLFARIIGSTISYWLGTLIRKGIYIRFISEEEQVRLKRYTEKIGWQTVIISRFMPSADTDLIAYISGIANMTYLSFILASFFGMLVPVAATVFIGATIFTNKTLFFVLVPLYIVGMLFAPKLVKKVLKSKIFLVRHIP
jgi:uncharacterized membrane protein YdjX (TVP38/TMEM64 family)